MYVISLKSYEEGLLHLLLTRTLPVFMTHPRVSITAHTPHIPKISSHDTPMNTPNQELQYAIPFLKHYFL